MANGICAESSHYTRPTTTKLARTWDWARMRRYAGPCNAPERLPPHQSHLGYTIVTRGSDLRERQPWSVEELDVKGSRRDPFFCDARSHPQCRWRGYERRLRYRYQMSAVRRHCSGRQGRSAESVLAPTLSFAPGSKQIGTPRDKPLDPLPHAVRLATVHAPLLDDKPLHVLGLVPPLPAALVRRRDRHLLHRAGQWRPSARLCLLGGGIRGKVWDRQ